MKTWLGLLLIFLETANMTSLFSATQRPLGKFGSFDRRSGIDSSRSVLVNLAKSLSTSLKQSMAANSEQVLEVTQSIQDLETAVEELNKAVGVNTAKREENANKLSTLAQITEQIQDRRDLDEMVWTFNTIVCNASIELMRQELTMSRYTKSNSSQGTNSREQVDTLIQQTNNILLSVEEKYTNLSNQIMSQGKILPPPPQISVDNASIKKLESKLSGLETKFDFLLKNLESALTSEDDDIRRQIDHKYEDISIQLNASSSRQAVSEVRMDVLEQLVLDIAEDKDQATTEDPLFGHDFSMLKAITPGRLETTQRSAHLISVGQTGLMEDRNNEDNNIFGLQNSPSNHDNFKPQQDRSPGRSFYDAQQQEFELKQAELLGFAPIQQSPIQQQRPIQQQSPIQQRPIQQSPIQQRPFQQSHIQQRPIQQSPIQQQRPIQQRIPIQQSPIQQRPFQQSPVQQSPIQQQSRGGRTLFEEPTQPNMSQDSAHQCQCSELQLKVGKLEGELSSMRKEMEGALSGLQETMTVLQHKIQEVELVARGEGPAPCVATKEAANMAGMDVWCMQNCAKGNCPPNLCTCPPKR